MKKTTKKEKSAKNKVGKKSLSKVTKDNMNKARIEDTIRLRKKAEELVSLAFEDKKTLAETYKLRKEQIATLEIQLLKNQGALDILTILLEG